jgi:hypothetical protein
MPTQTILFLAANPSGTSQLALDREARAIHHELERSGHRDEFDFVTRWAVEPLDLLRELRKLHPTVVHFSGHGATAASSSAPSDGAARRDITGGAGSAARRTAGGLYFQASDGSARLVSAGAIEQTFGAAGSSVRLVVLNACHSAPQAEALLAHVECVVGMTEAILDEAARAFAIGFYGGLGEREPIAAAVRQGKAAISLDGLPDAALPRLDVRPGIDPERMILTPGPARHPR